jgi:hypothetical protein
MISTYVTKSCELALPDKNLITLRFTMLKSLFSFSPIKDFVVRFHVLTAASLKMDSLLGYSVV